MTPDRWAGLRELAARRPFRRLIAAQALSQLGDGLYQIALASIVVFGVEAAETPGQVTKVLAVTTIPFSIVGPFTGPFIDRFSRRSLLAGSKIAMVAVTLAFLATTTEALILLLGVVNISINRFFHAAKNATLPTLVEPRQYLLANAVSTTVGMVTSLAGAVIGGPLAERVGHEVPIAMAAVCMAASAALAGTLRLARGEKRGLAGIASELRQNLRDVGEGIRVLRRTPQATYGVAAIWSMRALLGLLLITALVLLRARVDVGAGGFAILLGYLGVGGFAGALLVPLAARRVGFLGVAPAAMVVGAATTLLSGSVPATLPYIVLAGGIAVSMTKISADTLVQRSIPDRYRGRAFTVYELGYNGAFVVAGLMATGLRPLMGDLGVVILTTTLGLGLAVGLRRWGRRIPEPIEVRTYAGARGDEVPREVVLGGHTLAVSDVERTWREDRGGERLLCFRLRLADGSRVQVALGETWRLDARVPRSG